MNIKKKRNLNTAEDKKRFVDYMLFLIKADKQAKNKNPTRLPPTLVPSYGGLRRQGEVYPESRRVGQVKPKKQQIKPGHGLLAILSIFKTGWLFRQPIFLAKYSCLSAEVLT